MSAAIAAAYVLDCIGLSSGRPDGRIRISAAVAAAYVLDCIGLLSGRPDGRIRISAAVAVAYVLDCIGLSSGRQRVARPNKTPVNKALPFVHGRFSPYRTIQKAGAASSANVNSALILPL